MDKNNELLEVALTQVLTNQMAIMTGLAKLFPYDEREDSYEVPELMISAYDNTQPLIEHLCKDIASKQLTGAHEDEKKEK